MSPRLALLDVVNRAVPAEPWADGDNIPWWDPAFSARMLRVHLSQEHDLASRRIEIVERHVEWLHHHVMGGRLGRVLDLGCGPGLYLHRLARLGHVAVGIDFGPASIQYARDVAAAKGLDCTFRLEDLRQAELGRGFDLVFMLWGQLNVFRRTEALGLLRRACHAAAPEGRLVLEIQRLESLRGDGGAASSWSTEREGLFSDRPHVLLHERFWDEPRRCRTERWHVVDAETGAVARHALTAEGYTREQISAVLVAAGFEVSELLPSLPGTPGEPPCFAVVARPPSRPP